MDRDQGKIVSGSVYDAPLHSGSTKYKEGRMPHLGQKVTFRDGREFVFVSTAVDGVAGSIVAQATALATPIDNKCTAASAGATTVIIDITGSTIFGNLSTLAADRMADGFIVTNDGAGAGYSYKVKSNTVQDADAKVTFTLYDALKVDITAATDIVFIGPKHRLVVAGTATLQPVGVLVVPSTAGTNARTEYLWAQTKGLAAVLNTTGTNVAIGLKAACTASAGTIIPTAVTEIIIGTFMATDTAGSVTVPVLLDIPS